jgi:hypothetical protein
MAYKKKKKKKRWSILHQTFQEGAYFFLFRLIVQPTIRFLKPKSREFSLQSCQTEALSVLSSFTGLLSMFLLKFLSISPPFHSLQQSLLSLLASNVLLLIFLLLDKLISLLLAWGSFISLLWPQRGKAWLHWVLVPLS